MRLRSKMAVAAMVAAAAGMSACGGKKGGGSTAPGNNTTTPAAESTVVTMAGSLALTSGDGLSLTLATYDLYCVTYADTPAACKVEVDTTTGAFNKDCENFANNSFGCFIRENGKSLGSIEFEEGTALTAGAGALKFDIKFDKATGIAKATIDRTASSALGTAKGEVTTMADLTGTWNIKADPKFTTEFSGEGGGEELPAEGFDLYFNQFDHAGKKYISMWSNTAQRDVCMAGGGTEVSPKFAINFDTTSAAMDFTSMAKFEQSLDSLYASLPSDLKTEVVRAVRARTSYLQSCENNPVSSGSCKFAVAAMFTEPNSGASWPRPWAYDEYASIEEYTGDVAATETQCFTKDPVEGMPPCPGHVMSDDNVATVTTYQVDGKPMRLVCQMAGNTQDLFQIDAMGATKAAAISGFERPECATVSGGEYNGLYKAQVDETRRVVLDLFRAQDHGGPGGGEYDSCSRFEIPNSFTFNDCSDDPMSGAEQPSVCYQTMDFGGGGPLQMYGMRKGSSGKIESSGDPIMGGWWIGEDGPFLCPTAYAAFKADMEDGGLDGDHMTAQNGYATNCRTEFVGLSSARDQAVRLQSTSMKWQPLSDQLCLRPATDPIRTKVKAAIAGSCLPDVQYDMFCSRDGKCRTSLRCQGSGAGGKCFTDDGMFAGRVSGRDDVMALRFLVGGAFSMSKTTTDSWFSYDFESESQQQCIFASQFLINAKKISDTSFSGVVSQKEKMSCESSAEDDSTASLNNPPGSMPGGPGGSPDGGGSGGGSGDGKGEDSTFTMGIIATKK